MRESWLLLAVTLTLAGIALCRDLIALCCYVVRRASIERIIAATTERMLIVDSTAEGATLVVEVQPSVAASSSIPAAKDHDK